MERVEEWNDKKDYIDLLLFTKHHTISKYTIINQLEDIDSIPKEIVTINIGVKGALKNWWIKKLRNQQLRNNVIGKGLLKIKKVLGIKLY